MLNLSKEKLLIIIALFLAGVSLTASIVLSLQVIKLKQDLTRQLFLVPTPSPTPIPKLGLSPAPSPRISPTSVSEEKLPPEAKACQKDGDCFLGLCSGCDPCLGTRDLSDPIIEALNKDWCQQQKNLFQEKMRKLGLSCLACTSVFTNKNNLQAKCINNICTKAK